MELPPIPSFASNEGSDPEGRFRKAITELTKTFKLRENDTAKIKILFKDNYDSVGIDLSYIGLGNLQWQISEQTAYAQIKISELNIGDIIYICRSQDKWLILPENPVDKWQDLDKFFQVSAGLPDLVKKAEVEGADTLLDDTLELADDVLNLLDDASKSIVENVEKLSTGVASSIKDVISFFNPFD